MWQLDGSLGNLQTDSLAGKIDLQQPQRGLHALRVTTGGHTIDLSTVSLLGLNLPGSSSPEEVRERWVRGSDLVAVYAPNSHRASQPEIYWRFLTSVDAVGLELIVSMQTGLLDDNPETRTTSELPIGETWWLPFATTPALARNLSELMAVAQSGDRPQHSGDREKRSESAASATLRDVDGPGTFVVRLPNKVSYLEMIHPSDFCSTEAACRGGRIELRTPLFPERLEKGVIRRGRIRGWFVPTANDLAAAERLFREFAQSEPPLTT